MTNSDDALRACPFCGEKLSHNSGKINRIGRCDTADCWMSDRKMTVPLDDPHQVEQWNRRPSPVAGGDLRVRALEGANTHYFDFRIVVGDGDGIERGDGGECIAFADDPWASRIVAALNQPAAPVEAVERALPIVAVANKLQGRQDHEHETIPTGLIRACAAVVNGVAFAPMLAAMRAHPPEPAASTVAQGEG